jgi:transcriptional regulator with XRE-family HTH domain
VQDDIQARLRRFRQRGVTNRAIEDALGLSSSYLSKVGRGKRPSRLLVAALALLEVDLERGLRILDRLERVLRPGFADVGEVLTDSGRSWCLGGTHALRAHGVAVHEAEEELALLYVAGLPRGALPQLRERGFAASRFADSTFLVAHPEPGFVQTLLFFPTFAPATSACADPDRILYLGRTFPVFPLEWLTVCLLMRRDRVSAAHAHRALSQDPSLRTDVELVFDGLEQLEARPSAWTRDHFYDVARGRARLAQAPDE